MVLMPGLSTVLVLGDLLRHRYALYACTAVRQTGSRKVALKKCSHDLESFFFGIKGARLTVAGNTLFVLTPEGSLRGLTLGRSADPRGSTGATLTRSKSF